MQDCALCRCAFEPKEQSHIVSAFVYRWLKSTSVTGFMRFGRSMNVRAQDGIKDYFLCEACEDRLNPWERVFAQDLFYPFVGNSSVSIEYGEDILKFAVSASWRVLAYAKQKGRLNHFRGRHERAINESLETWSSYLLGTVDHIGRHEIHLLPFSGVVEYSGDDIPPNFNRYLRRAVEIDTVVSDHEAVTYCKLGPLILIGLIEYPDPSHWENTKIQKSGRFGPCTTSCPAQYRDYMFKRSARLKELEKGLSAKQLDVIEQSYAKNSAKFEGSETIQATISDLELRFRRGEFEE
jgi:hypothetical protein